MNDIYAMRPTKTVYAGIAMASRLEGAFAAWLDQQHIKWSYIASDPAFAGPHGPQYRPDFEVMGPVPNYPFGGPRFFGQKMGSRLFVETKPPVRDAIRQALYAMPTIWDTLPSATLIVAYPRIERPSYGDWQLLVARRVLVWSECSPDVRGRTDDSWELGFDRLRKLDDHDLTLDHLRLAPPTELLR